MEKSKEMSFKEFVENGYLQEANRKFFLPLGLLLEVNSEDENFYHILDFRENLKEGYDIFKKEYERDENDSIKKKKNIEHEETSKSILFVELDIKRNSYKNTLADLFSDNASKSANEFLKIVDKETAISIINRLIKPHSDEPDWIFWDIVEDFIKK